MSGPQVSHYLELQQDADFAYDLPGVVARLQDLEGDVEFVAPCQTEADAYHSAGVPVHVYSFDFVPRGDVVEEDRRFYTMFGEHPVAVKRTDKARKGRRLDAFHGLDHAFIFTEGYYSSSFHIEPYGRREKAMSRIMSRDASVRGVVCTDNSNGALYCGAGTLQGAHAAAVASQLANLAGALEPGTQPLAVVLSRSSSSSAPCPTSASPVAAPALGSSVNSSHATGNSPTKVLVKRNGSITVALHK